MNGCEPRLEIPSSEISRRRRRTSIPWKTESLSVTRYKVVLVPFPFDDLSSTKVRPAVCLTDPLGPHRHVVLAFITSQTPSQPLKTDLKLDSGDPSFAATGLRVPSTLQLHRLMTASTALIRRQLGHLSPEIQERVATGLRSLFDLA
ncbi:MAG: type II toxin-antitoxin system PemK/MazF family toxin [Thermoanaerobaculia bacterium]